MRPPATPLTKIADIFKMKYDTFVKIYPILICRLLKENKKKKNKNHSNLRYLLFLNEINKYMYIYILYLFLSLESRLQILRGERNALTIA